MVKMGCGSQDGGIDLIMSDEWMEEEMLADKMQDRMFLLRMASSLFKGMTVAEFNERFKGMNSCAIRKYFQIILAERKQFGGPVA